MKNGTVFVPFSQKYKNLVSSKSPIIVTATPNGPTNGVYISSVSKEGFTIVENNKGTSSVQVTWIAIGTKAGYEEVEISPEILSSDYDKNMDGVMSNDSNPAGNGTPIWWDGKKVRHDEQPASLKQKTPESPASPTEGKK